MVRTQEENCALFLLILEDIENGMFVEKSCKKHGVNHSTFLNWQQGNTAYIPDASANYARAVEARANSWASKAMDVAFAPPVSNEFGIDKGDVELRKVQIDSLKWVTAQTSKKWSAKAHDAEEQKPKDIGAIVVNLIQDTKPRD
jgi:hypothetical protein